MRTYRLYRLQATGPKHKSALRRHKTMASWNLLDERSESELHKTRLLNVEEKPLKRITKRLAAISSAVSRARGVLDPSSSSEQNRGSSATATATATAPAPAAAAAAAGDGGGVENGPGPGENSLLIDLTHDFAAFDSSIARFQFLYDASRRERERYGADQQRILTECEAVRANNSRLREQLEAARATLAQRNKFDELAERITSNRLLRPRDDQRVNLAKLEEECRELERESETYRGTWKERRDQFNRIMEEGMMLRRLIRDEKEEVDRREGMNEEADDEADAPAGQTPRMTAATGDESTPPTAEVDGASSNNQPMKLAARLLEAGDAGTPARSDQAPDDGSRDDVDMEDGEERPAPGTDEERGSGSNPGVESTEEENMVVDE
ncbi:hypothetical protein L249_6858 [Ophiocordyceps polyrhachis-furcata BCC 54312]|uniref:Tho complex subunit 7/Mft1p n=1 Tax=Ophiocordyceps polyrhachis-furcata BCC 54312 TaxID=1330021 RepID=A0A367LJB8_9HYPO|nr:hypothetical protein L249_6858 [Ophiocordyceps polyrhachis-furcata BCC 54312]